MNQGKLEVVKQEMIRVNIDILGIRDLKWTGMGEFNSDDHYIYYCKQNSLRRNGVAVMHRACISEPTERKQVLRSNAKRQEGSLFLAR